MSQYYDQTSESIYDGVLTIFGRAATQDLNMPSRSKLNVDAQAHIHMKTELFVSDAAADEVLVGRMMKKRRMNDVFVDPDFFPGMRHRLNDRAHAFRRVTKRGWRWYIVGKTAAVRGTAMAVAIVVPHGFYICLFIFSMYACMLVPGHQHPIAMSITCTFVGMVVLRHQQHGIYICLFCVSTCSMHFVRTVVMLSVAMHATAVRYRY